jgi:hypothetical protein
MRRRCAEPDYAVSGTRLSVLYALKRRQWVFHEEQGPNMKPQLSTDPGYLPAAFFA